MPPPIQDIYAYFWGKVDILGPNNCWIWQDLKDYKGYGKVSLRWRGQRRTMGAHRVAWELTFGFLLPGIQVLHHCDVRACVNVRHLFLGTNFDNARDRHIKGRDGFPDPLTVTGEKNPQAKLSDAERDKIRRLRTEGIPCAQVAKEFGIHPVHVSHICRDTRKHHKARLTPAQIVDIYTWRQEGFSLRKIAQRLQVAHSTVWHMVNNKRGKNA